MTNQIATPKTLSDLLAKVQPGDTIQLDNGDYPGTYDLRTPNVTLEPAPGAAPRFTGPAAFTSSKVAWLHIWPTATGATVRNLSFWRSGDIKALWRADWNDYGIVNEASGVLIENCTLGGMAKGIHVKGAKSTGGTIVHNRIGPTIFSCIVMGTSYGVVRGQLIGWNTLQGSLREDAVQFMPNFDVIDPATDVSNLGTILYENTVQDCNENAYDMKGAGLIVIHGGEISGMAGYNNGYPFDSKYHYGPVIMHGAGANSGLVIVRNVHLHDNAGGIRVFPLWHIYHNLLENDNYDPLSDNWQGKGIFQPGATPGATLKNNLSHGHKGSDYSLASPTADFAGNKTEPGSGVPLTRTRGAGLGDVLPVEDVGYFTDWFGRKDLPPDVIWLNGWDYKVLRVNRDDSTLELDEGAKWQDGDPVYWRSPQPVAGIQAEYESPIVVEPPPTGPPTTSTDETVQLVLEASMSPAEAAQLRALLKGRAVNVRLG